MLQNATLFGFLVVVFGAGIVLSADMYFRDCGKGEVKKITIEPCKSQPCHFDQGQRANLTIVFVPKHAVSSMVVKSTLRRGGLFDYEIEVPENDPSVCRGEGNLTKNWGKVDCPLEAEKEYTYVIDRAFPVSTKWNIFRYSKLKLLSDDGRVIACADMHLQFNRRILSWHNSN